MKKKNDFEGLNTVEKFSAPPAVWERLKRYCKQSGIRPSQYVCRAIIEKLNREGFD